MSLAASVTTIGSALTAGGIAVAQLRHDVEQSAARRHAEMIRRRYRPRPFTLGELVLIRFPNGMFVFQVTDPSPPPAQVPNGQSSLYLLARQHQVPGAPTYAVRRDQVQRRAQSPNAQPDQDSRQRKEQRRDSIGRVVATAAAGIAIALAVGATFVAIYP